MENYKLHVKVGANEFNGEGPEEAVRRSFAEWKELIEQAPKPPGTPVPLSPLGASNGESSPVRDLPAGAERLFNDHDKQGFVSLRFQPRGEQRAADAILLILLGHRLLRNEHEVGVSEIKLALKQTGITIERVDKVASRYLGEYLNKGGSRKGSRYSLTNPGVARAEELMAGLLN